MSDEKEQEHPGRWPVTRGKNWGDRKRYPRNDWEVPTEDLVSVTDYILSVERERDELRAKVRELEEDLEREVHEHETLRTNLDRAEQYRAYCQRNPGKHLSAEEWWNEKEHE